MAAYEDTFYYLWRERRLPVNVDPLDSKIADPVERAAAVARSSSRIWARRSGTCFRCAGCRRDPGTPRWTSQPWFTASERLFLVPGDSPLGYRLPLESLPWTKPEDVEYSYDPDPFQTREQASRRPESQAPSVHGCASLKTRADRISRQFPKKGESAGWVSRPALCVQVREGKLYVFMPPVEFLADYLDLISAIEDTAAHLRMPVAIEGYAPPLDPRISVLKVTPDPGVIEVNIHPARIMGRTGGEHD